MRPIIDWMRRSWRKPAFSDDPRPEIRHVLLTGAAGGAAGMIRPALASRYRTLRLTDCRNVEPASPSESFVPAALEDAEAIARAAAGMDGIVHLGAVSKEAAFEELLPANVIGVHNVLEAARRAGIRRVVLASSMHVMGFYERDARLDESSPPRPDSRYAASKAFAEALAHVYACKHGLSVTCLRIGHVADAASDAEPGNWISPQDLVQLIAIGLEHPDIAFEIFHAVADHRGLRLSDGRARRYGYRCQRPGGSIAEVATGLSGWFGSHGVAKVFRGGYFAAAEFDGDTGERPRAGRP